MTTDSSGEGSVEAWLDRQESGQPDLRLSIVVPAYNEALRLPATLIDMIDYLDVNAAHWEILVVDDGSADSTSEVVRKFEKLRKQIRLIRVPRNYGKGHAVRTGMLNAHGKRIVFSDADGATSIRELPRLLAALDRGADVAIGSRALASTDTTVTTLWYRKILGRMFNFFVNLLLIPGIADTQCGFKAFTSASASFLFNRQQSDGFSFDIEILCLAQKTAMKVEEVPINWTNIPGSKVNLLLDSLRMFRDIFVFRIRHREVTPVDFEQFANERQS